MYIEGLSLDQLRAVLTVVETGSFSAAARRFGRAQSAVSYAIASAEAQLGVLLFERGGKRPELTPTGRALIGDIRAIVARTDDLKARAEAAARGAETELRLAVDAVWPATALSTSLAEFAREYPALPVHIHVDSLGMVVDRVTSGAASIGIVATINDLPDGLTRYTLPPVGMTAVAAPEYPLAACAEALTPEEVQAGLQIVLSDRSLRTEGRDFATLSARTWRVADLATKLELIRAGIGWGCLPDWQVEADLAAAKLVVIQVPGLPAKDWLTPQAFHVAGHRPGPAGSWLIERLHKAAGEPRPE